MQHRIIKVPIAVILIIRIVSTAVYAIYNSIIFDKDEKLALIDACSNERLEIINKGMDLSLVDFNKKKLNRPA